MKISLVEPSIKYKDSFLKGINEYFNMDEDIEGTGFIQKKLKNSYTDAEFNKEIIEIYKEHKKGVNLPSTDWPSYSETWIIADGVFVGAIFDKDYFPTKNSESGGNIGYFTVPSFRRKGIMKKAMELYIKQIKKDKIIGCEPSNIGSRKIIEYLATKFKNIKEEDGIFTFDDGTKITCIRWRFIA